MIPQELAPGLDPGVDTGVRIMPEKTDGLPAGRAPVVVLENEP